MIIVTLLEHGLGGLARYFGVVVEGIEELMEMMEQLSLLAVSVK